jgi:hypothetical protein
MQAIVIALLIPALMMLRRSEPPALPGPIKSAAYQSIS